MKDGLAFEVLCIRINPILVNVSVPICLVFTVIIAKLTLAHQWCLAIRISVGVDVTSDLDEAPDLSFGMMRIDQVPRIISSLIGGSSISSLP